MQFLAFLLQCLELPAMAAHKCTIRQTAPMTTVIRSLPNTSFLFHNSLLLLIELVLVGGLPLPFWFSTCRRRRLLRGSPFG